MSVHSCNSADDWTTMSDCKVRVDGAWKQCKTIHAYVDGTWKKVWLFLTVTLTSDNVEHEYTDDAHALASMYPEVITVSDVSGAGASSWVVPDEGELVVAPIDDDGYVADKYSVCYKKTSDTTWGNPEQLYPEYLPVGTHKLVVVTEDLAIRPYSNCFSVETVISNLGTLTVKQAAQPFLDPFYPYFSSTGNQHTTGIGLNQPSALYDLVIKKYTSSSSEGEYFPSGTWFRIDQKGNGSGYTIFSVNATGTVSSITNNSGWTVNAFAADSAVLTAIDGGTYWWDGTKAVSSVTLTIN